jgi:hypothetical protein
MVTLDGCIQLIPRIEWVITWQCVLRVYGVEVYDMVRHIYIILLEYKFGV